MAQERRRAGSIPRWLIWLRAIRIWAPLGVVFVMLLALAAILLRVPEPGRGIAEWAFPLSAVELGISSVKALIRDIRMDPEKRRRIERAWHTVGMHILVGGGITAIAGMFVVYGSLIISERGGHISDIVFMPAAVVAGIGWAGFFIGLVTFLIEDAIRGSR